MGLLQKDTEAPATSNQESGPAGPALLPERFSSSTSAGNAFLCLKSCSHFSPSCKFLEVVQNTLYDRTVVLAFLTSTGPGLLVSQPLYGEGVVLSDSL